MKDAQLAKELIAVIEQRKRLDKRESDLKDLFKIKMTNQGINTLTLGNVLVSLVQKSRTALDKKALVTAYGEEVIGQFEKVTEFIQVDVKDESVTDSKKAA
ncbi:MAG: hypothetical protein A4S09_17355 [Proteobacteria bacterium SG_bin7]|nr:MAG: hypothetical protein A4S09_17355 [Proteobacteria bacterium SG_bin7]